MKDNDPLGLKATRTIKWWHFWKWSRAIRHAWVTRKLPLTGTPHVCEEAALHDCAVAMMQFEFDRRPGLPAIFMDEPYFPSGCDKFPTVLSAEDLASIVRSETAGIK